MEWVTPLNRQPSKSPTSATQPRSSQPRNPKPYKKPTPLSHAVGTLRVKFAALVSIAVTLAALFTWLGMRFSFGPSVTLPVIVVTAVVVVPLAARGMTSPLREMTRAARAMADGDYSARVAVRGSHDELGSLTAAFNSMAQELQANDQARRELVANVSHELRTPVAALQAQLENMVDGVTPTTTAVLEGALGQTERLTRLITYLLDLSRVEAGASALHIAPIDLGDFLEECAHDLSMVEASKDLHFLIDVSPDDLVLQADSERLRQIIVNLVNNAIRHSPTGGEILLVAYTTAQRDGQGGEVVIEISDEGPGIAPHEREQVFERFALGSRGAATSSMSAAGGTASGGTGIGLSIVRWAVQLHGGRVEVVDASRAGRQQGACVRLVFPQPVAA